MKRTARFITLASVLVAAGFAHAKDASEATRKKTARPQIEVCFVLDTTGSMSGLIEGAKQKIWSMANEMISARPTPEIKLGLIGYRDRGDEYVTKAFGLTGDIDSIYGQLQSFHAAGGGDTPESVNEALHEAVHKISWSKDRGVLKIIFLVGDAPPHMDYADGPKYPDVCKEAVKKDLIINTVQCGTMSDTTPVWKEIAQLSEGSYAAIAQSGDMVAIRTPADDELARLNRELNKTAIAYGDERMRRAVAGKLAAADIAPAPVAADRLSFSLRTEGQVVTGSGELLGELADGRAKLENVKKEQLPAELQKLSDEELKDYVEKQKKTRDELQARIQELDKKRQAYIDAEKKRLAAQGKGDAFDEKVAEMIRAEAAKKGIQYGK